MEFKQIESIVGKTISSVEVNRDYTKSITSLKITFSDGTEMDVGSSAFLDQTSELNVDVWGE